MNPAPFISVVIPCRNERAHIDRCLAAVLANEWPADRMEVLVVDGMSYDGTRDILAAWAARDPRVRMLDNAGKVTPRAMNIGIREARGDFIVRVDAHAEIPATYLEQGVAVLTARADVWAAGGPVARVGIGPGGELVAALTSHWFSTGNTNVRVGEVEGPVDAVLYSVWRREVFQRIGLFDEDLVRNQDDDYHLRIRLAGGVIYQLPSMRARYYVRGTPAQLLRQYAQYGFWKVVVARKHGRFADWKPLVPLAALVLVIALALGYFITPVLAWTAASLTGLYVLLDVLAAATVGRRLGPAAFFKALAFFPLLHFRYAWGMLRGISACYLQRLTAAEIKGRGLYGGLTR